jgi:hypothetical protein
MQQFGRHHGMITGVTSPPSSKLRPPSELIAWAGPDYTDMANLFGAACREYQARPAYRVDGTWITYATACAWLPHRGVAP